MRNLEEKMNYAVAVGRLVCCLFFMMFVILPVRAEPNKFIDVSDLARFATIGNPKMLSSTYAPSGEVGPYSPDGRYVAVVVTGGSPVRRTKDAVLLVYRVQSLLHDTPPVKLAEFSSDGTLRPIAGVRWLEDSETLLFAGTRLGTSSQIYSVNVRTGTLTPLTALSDQLVAFDSASSGERLVVFRETASNPPLTSPGCQRIGCRIDAKTLFEAERGRGVSNTKVEIYDLRTGQSRSLATPEGTDNTVDYCDAEFSGGLSAEGRFAIRMCALKQDKIPKWWAEYSADPKLRSHLERGNPHYFRRGVLMDLERNEVVTWSDAPMVWPFVAPIWIDRGRVVIFPGVFESLVGAHGREREEKRSALAILSMDPSTRAITRIAQLDSKVARVSQAAWNAEQQILALKTEDGKGTSLQAACYQRRDQSWVAMNSCEAPSNTRASSNVLLTIEESLNEPPVLIATNKQTGERRRVLDPNPWLQEKQLGRVEAMAWKAKDGHEWKGVIYYPPNFRRGVRYPVLLQTHGLNLKKFSLHGTTTNYPGQAMAGHEVLVLQICNCFRGPVAPEDEWPAAQAGYEGAIDHLDRLGLINRNRVGIMGYSWTGTNVAYTLTHSDYPFAAAAYGETAFIGWNFYLMDGASVYNDGVYGAAPFGRGLGAWLERSPTFSMDRLRTPQLMWIGGISGPLAGVWDWYAGLKRIGVPIEYWFLPNGTHNIYETSALIHTNQLFVDWFRFWLKDEEDPAPEKAEQYSRWRTFREQQAALLKKERPPLLHWHATPRGRTSN